MLINLLPTGFHGDSNTHPAAARCQAGHFTPGISVWVIAFHTVQKSVAIVASCRESEENGHPSEGSAHYAPTKRQQKPEGKRSHLFVMDREGVECGSVVKLLPRLPSEGEVQGRKCWGGGLSGRAAAQNTPVGRGTIKEHLPSIRESLASIYSAPKLEKEKIRTLKCVFHPDPASEGLTEDVDPALVHSNPQRAPAMLHGGYESPGLCLHVVAFHAVQLVLPIVASCGIDAAVQHTDP